MFKCQVLGKLFICLIISRWRSHFYDHWCHPVFLLIPCIFSGTVVKNEKHFPSFSYGIPYNTTVAKDPNDVFLLWVWHQKLFHLYTSSCNWNCFLIHRYIYFPVSFLLLILFLFKHTNIIQIFKFTSEKRGGKYAFCINWVNIHIYKSTFLFVGMIDRYQQCDQHSTFHFFMYFSFYFYTCVYKHNLMFSSAFPVFSATPDKFCIDEGLITSWPTIINFMEIMRKTWKLTFSDLALLLESCSSWPWTWNMLKNQWLLRN